MRVHSSKALAQALTEESGHSTRNKDPEGLSSPCLLHLSTGPGQTAHVAHGPVRLGERPEDAEHWIGHHDDQRQGPCGGDDPVGVGTGLPGAGLEGIADGAVALDSDGHQAEGGDTD